jgi:hypothetical protein
MPRKKANREPSPKEEGAQILEAAAKAGADYAMEQVGGDHFHDWVWEQLVEAERMRATDPSSVFPNDTPAGAKRAARNMLQQLEWDTKRQMGAREVLDLSGAKGVFESGSASWVRDTYGITERDVTSAFFDSFVEALKSPSTVAWLTDEVLQQGEELRGAVKSKLAREARRPTAHRRPSGHQVADFSTLPEIIEHARREGGATHVRVAGANTTIYYPTSDGEYEQAKVWRQGGYWHGQAPGDRAIVGRLPAGEQAIDDYLARGWQRTAEARRSSRVESRGAPKSQQRPPQRRR